MRKTKHPTEVENINQEKELSEYHEQCAVFHWARLNEKMIPELVLLNGSLNGIKLSIGAAVKCKRIGMKAGWPDINLPIAGGGFNQLFIEMKFGKNKQSEKQVEMQKILQKYGNFYKVCYSCAEAISTIRNYLGGAPC